MNPDNNPNQRRQERAAAVQPLPEEISEGLTVKLPGEYQAQYPFNEEVSRVRLDEYRSQQYAGKFSTNNATVAFVDENLDFHVAPYTSTLTHALREAGYQHDTFFVPLSNGELPLDPAIRIKFLRLSKEAQAQREQERLKSRVETYEAEAAARSITPGLGKKGPFLMVDRMEYTHIDSDKVYRLGDAYDLNMPIDRNMQVGTYDKNNGVIAFVDEKGRLYVASESQETLDLLEEHGYQRSSMFVPFSNGEQPVSKVDQVTLQQMMKQP
ncbi:MAG: hypothetical protein D6719_00730 [Candidatus Dadabacteria bacterium]|nr:MAG: hypothetical protein D6719_00730 [Candidatus Dadabacteria bacterium]